MLYNTMDGSPSKQGNTAGVPTAGLANPTTLQHSACGHASVSWNTETRQLWSWGEGHGKDVDRWVCEVRSVSHFAAPRMGRAFRRL